MFDEIETYIDNIDTTFIDFNTSVDRWNIKSNIDIVDEKDNIWTIKCSEEISLKHTLKAILQYLMYNKELLNDDINQNETITVSLRFLNLLKGNICCYEYQINCDLIKNIIE